MPETMNITPRRSIHSGNSHLSETENPEQSEDYHNDSQSFSHTESGSGQEALDIQHQSFSQKVRIRKAPKGSRSVSRTQSAKQQDQQRNFPDHFVPESCMSKVKQTNNTGFMMMPLMVVFIIVAIFGAYLYTTKNVYSDTTENVCSFEKLRKIYPEQEPKVWKYLKVGIESILQKRVTSPGVYLFVHQGSERGKQLVINIASHSSSCFGHDKRPVKMESNDFNSDEVLIDYGYAIKKFKEKIRNGNVILIANLNEIPAKAARALHSICDTASPIAPDLVIFLTLTVPDIDGGNIESITEDALKNLWGQHLAYNELDPLITRVTDQVIALKS